MSKDGREILTVYNPIVGGKPRTMYKEVFDEKVRQGESWLELKNEPKPIKPIEEVVTDEIQETEKKSTRKKSTK